MPSCAICARLPLKGHAVSHSNIKVIKRQKLNLQTKTICGKKLKVCTSCLKTLAKPALKNKKTK
ncbi:MAG: bL28 family ribosomal protein [Patescibacteria group bacterium]